MKITVSHCQICGRAMVPSSQYQRNPALRHKYVAGHAHGKCSGCYHTARYPAARRNHRSITTGDPCRSCGRPMMTARKYYQSPASHPSYVPLGGQSMCVVCYRKARRAGTLPDPPPHRLATSAPRTNTNQRSDSRLNTTHSVDPATVAFLREAAGLTITQMRRRDS